VRPQTGSRHSAKLARNPARRRFAGLSQPILGEHTPFPDISCKTVHPYLTHLLSMVSDPILQSHAAAVFQYADANQHKYYDLPESPIDAEEQ
jgi:hypothetical protein